MSEPDSADPPNDVSGDWRINRWFDCGFLLAWSWICMTLMHECGHIAVGCSIGGDLRGFELRPWCLPHSHFASNPFPLLTLWAGPLLGCIVPLSVACIVRKPAVWFVAWFCVAANGLYLLLGYYSGDSELDSTKIVQFGTPSWVLVVVASAMSVLGYVGFRSEFQRRMNHQTPAIERRTMMLSAGGMIALVLLLAVFGAG